MKDVIKLVAAVLCVVIAIALILWVVNWRENGISNNDFGFCIVVLVWAIIAFLFYFAIGLILDAFFGIELY